MAVRANEGFPWLSRRSDPYRNVSRTPVSIHAALVSLCQKVVDTERSPPSGPRTRSLVPFPEISRKGVVFYMVVRREATVSNG